ncbi:MAG TPA: haloacid dehalogenase-like hydrolase [Polyangiaceae bacterium]|nr:haloacid dehalogenase-like hydrolase [Polyangiaceae bacterium]
MQKVNREQILAGIEREVQREPGGAVAFDGDGTLWEGDVAEDFFFTLLQHGDLREPAISALRREAEDCGIDPSGSPAILAKRLFDEYQLGNYPELRCCEMMSWCCAGWHRDEVLRFANRVMDERKLTSRLHREILSIVDWVRGKGIETLLVSASPLAIVEPAGQSLGFAPAQIAAATAAFDGDIMAARMASPVPHDPGKMVAIAARIGSRPLYAAFGDNIYDVAMLKAARIAVTYRPKARLLKRLDEIPGIVELSDNG